MKIKKLVTILSLASILTLPAAVLAEAETAAPASAPKFGDYQSKGFLTDYSKISKIKDDTDSYEYRDPNIDYKKYNKLLVDRIKI